MKILYGTDTHSIDVTNICFAKLKQDNIITIPSGDCNRAEYFTDPLLGVLKKIMVEYQGVVTEYDDCNQIEINTTHVRCLSNIHSKLKIKYGSFMEELPEQELAFKYITSNNKVLEIGANIGRNSLVIASILENNDNNFIALESSPDISNQLMENRDLNNFKFHVEPSALSKQKLIQYGWNTKPSEILEPGHNWVNTITLEDLKTKYNIVFDTLVLDCEGAFYYILMDMPEILDNVNLILMENDYWDISQKNYIDEVLIKNNFVVIETIPGGWGPCFNNFFEAWKKNPSPPAV